MVNIEVSKTFLKSAKKLKKKYPSLGSDILNLQEQFKDNPELGVSLGGKLRKVKLAIKSKGAGKRSGARIISYHELIITQEEEHRIILLNIYDKSEKENVTLEEIESWLQDNGLL
ncbi:MAG: hypothetical protein AB8B61_09895 [Cyclobacteriaceae bacterium]